MSDQFVAEIRIVGFNFAPTGWAFCNGQLMPISQNTALFSLLGTYYGGDGKSNFALPNLQGSAPMQQGQGPGLSLRSLGETGGEQNVTLLNSEIPSHTHQANGLSSAGASSPSPAGNVWARTRALLYNTSQNTTMAGQVTTVSGSSLPHNNLPPYLVLNYIIALQGIYPPRT